MGNNRSRGRNSSAGDNQEVDRRVNLTWPSMSVTWVDYQERRGAHDPSNGFELNGHAVPETVMEVILSHVGVEDILNCNLVCRNWKDIITRNSYWKQWFDRKEWDWNLIPDYVKERPQSWIVMYSQLKHNICLKNFVINHSGEAGFNGWTRFHDGGDGWRIENPPEGCDVLPDDPFFGNSTSAFVSSFGWCSKWQEIDLWKMGLTPPVMITSLPFELVCSQKYTNRFDCGGVFKWTLRILDSNKEAIMDSTDEVTSQPTSEWRTINHAFRFKEEYQSKMDQVRYVVFIHEGKDNQFWKGHYGPKFARSCVKFRIRELDAREKLSKCGVFDVSNKWNPLHGDPHSDIDLD